MKKSKLRKLIRESIKELMTEQTLLQGAQVTAKICNPAPNECTGTKSDLNFITICDGPGWQNCATPQVGDWFLSNASPSSCTGGTGYNTSWEIVSIQGTGNENGKRQRYHQCEYVGVEGCTDPTACNYNSFADIDDGSCNLPDGCTDPTAYNYSPSATCDDGSCIYDWPDEEEYPHDLDVLSAEPSVPIYGCTMPSATNYNPALTPQQVCDGTNIAIGLSISSPCSISWGYPNAIVNTPTTGQVGPNCCCEWVGCTDPTANNWCSLCNMDDGSCTYTDPNKIPDIQAKRKPMDGDAEKERMMKLARIPTDSRNSEEEL